MATHYDCAKPASLCFELIVSWKEEDGGHGAYTSPYVGQEACIELVRIEGQGMTSCLHTLHLQQAALRLTLQDPWVNHV